jgi:hypothetical protein
MRGTDIDGFAAMLEDFGMVQPNAGIERAVLMNAAQTGGTECGNNRTGYVDGKAARCA